MTQTVESIIEEMHQLSEDDQRALAGAILDDQKLEAFVEELEDHLGCEASDLACEAGISVKPGALAPGENFLQDLEPAKRVKES